MMRHFKRHLKKIYFLNAFKKHKIKCKKLGIAFQRTDEINKLSDEWMTYQNNFQHYAKLINIALNKKSEYLMNLGSK